MRAAILAILLAISSTAMAGNYRYYYGNYYYYPQTIHEKIVIPVREVKLAEVKGLRILQDLNGKNYVEVDGKIVSLDSTNINEIITQSKENDKIVIERIYTR